MTAGRDGSSTEFLRGGTNNPLFAGDVLDDLANLGTREQRVLDNSGSDALDGAPAGRGVDEITRL